MPRTTSQTVLTDTVEAVRACKGDYEAAARKLGVSTQTVEERLKVPVGYQLPKQNPELWLAYWDSPNIETRNALVEEYRPWAERYLKAKLTRLPEQADTEAMIQAAMIRLMEAISRYNGSTKFTTFMAPHIRGGSLDELRQQDWVPRLARSKERKRTKLEDAGLNPKDHLTVKEWEESFPIHVKSLAQKIRTRHSSNESLYLEDVQVGVEDDDPVERLDILRTVTKGLNKDERLIIILYYYEQVTMKEIGKTLGVSESRVSQIHSNIIARLKQLPHVVEAFR